MSNADVREEMIADASASNSSRSKTSKLSTAPFWSGEGLVRAEPLTLRVYVAATKDGYRVMPGRPRAADPRRRRARATPRVGLQQRRLGDVG